MDWITLAVVVYLECSLLSFFALIDSDRRSRRGVTRGDVAFALFISATGPCGLGAAFAAIAHGKFKGFWSKQVWQRQPERPKA